MTAQRQDYNVERTFAIKAEIYVSSYRRCHKDRISNLPHEGAFLLQTQDQIQQDSVKHNVLTNRHTLNAPK